MSTQIRGNKQIKNITIENDQLVNGTVELNKLKEGAELIKRDGSVPFTADVDAGSHKIVNVAPGTNATDVVNKAQLDAVEAKVGGTLITREVVAGAKDGENVTFTLLETPTLGTEQIFFNGALLNAGANADYTLSGNTITFSVPPQSGDSILANYVVDAIQLNVDVQSTINQMNGRLTSVESDVAAAETNITALQAADVAMDTRMDAAESDISALEVRATNIESSVTAVVADVGAEETRAMAAESALDARVSSSEVEILGVKTRMTAAEGDISSLEAADVAMDTRASNLEDGLQAETVARTNAVNSLTSRVVALENDDTSVDGRLDVLETDVADLQGDLSSEAATRLANDNTLQSNINAEIANRTSAVSAVQSNLNIEIADRIAAVAAVQAEVDAEELARASAISALDLRIDALESDPVTQAYVDQKVSDLVNSAPAVLDTLKELSDALGGDENFAVTISAQIAAVDDRVDTVVANLAQEALDRAADVDAEETRAMAAEAALDGRVDALEAATVALNDLSDVTLTAPASGQVLKYNGSGWVNGVDSSFSGDYNDLSNKPSLFSGSYTDLSNKPNFAAVATSGSYNDLSDKPSIPSLTGYATESYVTTAIAGKADSSSLATVATSGSYNDLSNLPSLFSGAYADLSGKPSLFSGSYNDLSDKPNFSTVATSGSYNDLSDIPEGVMVTNGYQAFTGYKSFFESSIYSLQSHSVVGYEAGPLDLRATSPGANGSTIRLSSQELSSSIEFYTKNGSPYDENLVMKIGASGVAEMYAGAFVTTTSAANKPLIVKAAASQTANLFEIQNSASVAIFSVDKDGSLAAGTVPVARVSGLAAVATSGSYNDLSDKPSIPSISGLATETYVDTKVADLVASAPAVLDTLNELAAALGDDANFATTVSGQIGDVASDVSALDTRVTAAEGDIVSLQSDVAAKADSASLAAVATSGSYNDLTNKPSLAAVATSGSYNDLSNLPSLFSGAYADLTGKPSLATVATSGSYNDLSDKPSIPSLTGYATESYVTTAIAGKADSSSLAAVATSGSYADLSNKPTIYTPVKEVPAGTINGTNVTFTLSDAPAVAGTEQVFLNGLLQFAGASDDYTISGDTITFNTAPESGWKLVVCYFV